MRLFVAGHRGMVGRAVMRRLADLPGFEPIVRSSSDLDLTRQADVARFLRQQKPDGIILAAARVGGIGANSAEPARFIRDNMMIASNVIDGAHEAGVQKLVQIASSAIYPARAPQPVAEEALLTGPLDPIHEPYALAKIAAIKMCESYGRQYGRDYRSVVPTNLYGPGDNFHPEKAHVLPALLRRFHEAVRDGKDTVTVWGSGRPRREFLHVDDMARGVLHVFGLGRDVYDRETAPQRSHLNLGTGEDITIGDLCRLIAGITGFAGEIRFDESKPDGVMRKLLDVGRLTRLGWRAEIRLREGIEETYRWFCAQPDDRLRLV